MKTKVLTLLLATSLAMISQLADGFVMPKQLEENLSTNNGGGDTWAVLVAGSQGYFNYRHQADVCHAYQILKGHGIPDERIIVFMQDDIAFNKENPRPGKLFNRPKGPDVYQGVPKDYTKGNYTLANLFSVLGGSKPATGSGKTLKSGPNDNVFLFYADHGAPGLSGFCDETLMATKLNKAIEAMHQNKMYNQMVIYWESCESGSMFSSLLPSDINVLAVTAANPKESSYACYEDSILNTFLGDVFSVRWMEDSDKTGNLAHESIRQQVARVTQQTNTSHVMTYGDKKLETLHLSTFMGTKATTPQKFKQEPCFNKVPEQDVPIYILLERAWRATNNKEATAHLNQARQLKADRKTMLDKVMSLLRPHLDLDEDLTTTNTHTNEMTRAEMEECYYPLVMGFHDKCYKLGCNNYAYRVVRYFTDLCTSSKFKSVADRQAAVQTVVASMDTVCDINVRKATCGIE